MDGYATYDEATRRRAAALFDEGLGYKAAAGLLGIPRETVRKWLDIYRSVGIEVLAMMGKKHTAYPFETKLGAVRAVADGDMTKPEAMARFGIASPSVSVNLFFTSFAKQARRSRKGGFTGCANVFSPIPVTA